ncbi:multidrug resistance-associated protein 1-like [Ornithodoros turicata]|uniref:multidrug resistance-associated protein 1-like n=1 Tax=Ornithodoros turicata TaxID=34597 RepID=UPI00313957C1
MVGTRFCKTPFWDNDVTWNTEDPQLTQCFEDTVLTWIPAAVLVFFLPVKIAAIMEPKERPSPRTLLLWAKGVVLVCLTIVFSASVILCALAGESQAELSAAIVNTACTVIILLIQAVEHRRGHRTSSVHCIFWVINVVCSFPSFYRVLRGAFDHGYYGAPSRHRFISNMLAFPLICVLFVFYSFSEHRQDDDEKVCPLDEASPVSAVTFEWFTPLIFAGYRKSLTLPDLYPISKELKTTSNYKRWRQKNKHFRGSGLVRTMIRTYWSTFVIAVFMEVLFAAFRTLPPVFLTLIIRHVSTDEQKWKGYLYAVSIALASKTSMMIRRHCDFHFVLLGLQVKGVLCAAIYSKTLKIASASLNRYTAGEIINLITVDADKVYQLCLFMNLGTSAICMTFFVTLWLWYFLGSSAFTGLAILLIVLPLTLIIARTCDSLQQKLMRLKDTRLLHTSEALGNIRILKFYAWEIPFMNRILDTRDKEVSTLRSFAVLSASMRLCWFTAPFLQSLCVFMVYMFTNKIMTLDAATAFICVTLFNMLRMALAACPDVIRGIIQTSVAFKRIAAFLRAEEKDVASIGIDTGENNCIKLENASFSWHESRNEPTTLKDIHLTVEKGQLIGVFGLVGSGKSSLLNALLGEMKLTEGIINVSGTIAYVPQRAWIIHGTIRSNITFMKPYERHRYRRITDKCCLQNDFDIMMDKDKTEIGEKGVNLSGGQKQRISLARAVYLDKDIYLLDDPLSAVDAQVSAAIFNKVIGPKGILQDKTRIFITNNIKLLAYVDKIVFLQDGRIVDIGTYNELILKGGDFAHVVQEYGNVPTDVDERYDSSQAAAVESVEGSTSFSASALTRAQALVVDEAIQVGSIKKEVYINYIKNVGVIIFTVPFLGYTGCRALDVGGGLWLSRWSKDALLPAAEQTSALRTFRLVIYAVIGSCMGLFAFTGTSMLSMCGIKAARNLHEKMIRRLFEAQMAFFDSTPLGRILNRAGKDVDLLDIQLPLLANLFFELLFQILAMAVVLTFMFPLFLVAAIPLAVLYFVMQRVYLKTLRQLKRIEAVTRSPVVNTFAETLDGLSSVRSYSAEEIFTDRFHNDLDTTQNCTFLLLVAKLWLISRLDLIGCTLAVIVGCLIVSWRGDISPGTAGFLMSYMVTSMYALNNLVHYGAESEAAIVSSERVEEYTQVPIEAPRRILPPPPKDWPDKGAVCFVDYCARYRPGLRLCIKDVNLDVKPAEKVGIVGRTGAGKSTLTTSLFRILEPCSGKVIVDNIDISTIGLHDLRSKLTIIPQDAVLFSGDLRLNLDPLKEHDDTRIMAVLEIANLSHKFPEGLTGTTISEGGQNISYGQRQLLCLARAVLKHSKVLILDEATAALDMETDALMQRTIRTEFATSTVLTIAHRLHTILDADRVIVMADGEIVEMGPPGDLLKDELSKFYAMAKEAGIV